jgi:hypothetical protein
LAGAGHQVLAQALFGAVRALARIGLHGDDLFGNKTAYALAQVLLLGTGLKVDHDKAPVMLFKVLNIIPQDQQKSPTQETVRGFVW